MKWPVKAKGTHPREPEAGITGCPLIKRLKTLVCGYGVKVGD